MTRYDVQTRLRRHASTASACIGGACLSLAAATAPAAEAVIVSGVNENFGERFVQQSGSAYTIDDVCGPAPRIGPELKRMVDHVDQAMVEAGSPLTISRLQTIAGAPSRYDIERDVATATEEFCSNREPGGSIEPFVITYASCRMTMVTPNSTMAINIPSGAQTARMLMADHATSEVAYVDLNVDLMAAADAVGPGWTQAVEMIPLNQKRRHIGLETELYSYNVNSGLGQPGQTTGAPGMGSMVSVTSEGSAWVARNAPGKDVVRAFYDNLTRNVRLEDSSMFGGMIKNMAGSLREGLPLITQQEMTSQIMGRRMSVGKVRSVVTNIRVRDLEWSDCAPLPFPEGYTASDIGQQMSEAMGEAPSQDEFNQAMQEYQRAMQEMSPEERRMLEQMGMGDRMREMMGGAGPGQMPGAAAAGGAAAASAMPPSSELQSGDLTTSVQKHLQALGYDVGNTDGEMSMETTIAISTFQAEKGMPVTGEVSPQLLGILSAEVDNRR